jgi:hypothetical protein
MFSTESTKLDETLKLLNGLHDDSFLSKRKTICNYVQVLSLLDTVSSQNKKEYAHTKK